MSPRRGSAATRKRVLLLTEYPLEPERICCGPEAVGHRLAKGLSRYRDLEIHVLDCRDIDRDLEFSANNERSLLRVHVLASPRPKLFTRTVRDLPRIRRKIEAIRPDVIHALHLTSTYAALGTNYPVAWTPHGVEHHRRREEYYPGLRGYFQCKLALYIQHRCLKGVRDIVAVSNYVRDSLDPLTGARFHLIRNPIGEEFFALHNKDYRDEEEGRLLFVGSIWPLKGLLTLVEALKDIVPEMPAVNLRVVGRILDREYFHRVVSCVEGEGLGRRVVFCGLLGGDDLLQEYRRATALILPSRRESAGLAVMEAMAAGKPVVASRVAALPELVEEGRTGFLVEHGDVIGLADRIKTLLGDGELRRRMGEEGRKRAAAEFRLESIAARHRDLYLEMGGSAR